MPLIHLSTYKIFSSLFLHFRLAKHIRQAKSIFSKVILICLSNLGESFNKEIKSGEFVCHALKGTMCDPGDGEQHFIAVHWALGANYSIQNIFLALSIHEKVTHTGARIENTLYNKKEHKTFKWKHILEVKNFHLIYFVFVRVTSLPVSLSNQYIAIETHKNVCLYIDNTQVLETLKVIGIYI